MNLLRFCYGENNINTGPLKEIPEICIDHFVGDDLNSSVFFLSHAHTDHLVGLETEEFLRRLRQPGVKLYCHLLTPILLSYFERYLGGLDGIKRLISSKKIIPLEVECAHVLKIPRVAGTLHVTVTLLPAGHCPGSVMFLFETSEFRILHTGDFRLTIDDLMKMPALHQGKVPKPIDHLYIDTTFCSKSANLFPNRKQVLQDAMQRIQNWILLSKHHIVNISFAAKFAHEYVLLELFKKFKQKIHVTEERREIYRNVSELFEVVTLDKNTQFHLCNNKKDCVPNGTAITLRLSSMWYLKTKHENRKSVSSNGSFLNLCYSMHSSLEEISMTIDYLKPRVVTPLVLPKNAKLSEIHEALRSAVIHPFKFEDYHSSRDDFDGVAIPEEPCNEERDETDLREDDLIAEDIEPQPDANDESTGLTSSPSLLFDNSTAKRLRLTDGAAAWNFDLSPSPASKNSQSSSDNSQGMSEGSQDTFSQETGVNDQSKECFTRPLVPSTSKVRKNLLLTDLKNAEFLPEKIKEVNVGSNCYDDVNDSGPVVDDIEMNSQRLLS